MQKNLIYILLLISLFSLTFGCQTESYDFGREDGSIEVLEDGRLRVPILLHIPEREVVETKSAPSDAEKVVKTVDVCVFDASGNRLEKVSGVIDPSNSLRVFATVLPRNVACKVQVYVNIPARCRVAFNAADNKAIIDTLTMSNVIFNNDSITKNGLPMVSTLDSYTALNSTTLKGKVANLKFAYARIDVDVSSAADFNLVSCQKLNFRQISYLTEQTPLAYPNSIIEKIAVNQLSGIYLFESPGTNPTDLIIKGTKTGFGEGYYKIRIAYEDKDNNNKITYDIRRGVRYAVKITSVKGPGYASAKEAEENEPSNVEVDITVDDGSSKDVVISNGKYYLGLSNSEYIIYAADARGVIPVTITHNAPSTVTNAKITLSGAGMSFSSPLQSELELNANNNKEATIKQRDDSVHTIPLRIDFAEGNFAEESFTAGSITIRIGDLVKTIKVVRKAPISNSDSEITDFVNDDILVIRSHSDRIVVNGSSLTIKNAIDSNEKDKLYSIAEAYAQNERGTIVIAIKKKISSVVYYEKYGQNRYGIYSESGVISTLSSSEIILEAGYGVFHEYNIEKGIDIKFSNRNPVHVAAIQSDFVADSDFYLYPVSQNHTALSSQSDLTTLEVKTNDQSTGYYIYPNFAKGIYSSNGVTDGGASASPHVIRTPKQFQNINPIATNSESKFFKQERDLNFTDTGIGGAASFTSSIIANEFKGNYDGAGKRISNLKLNNTNQSMALFRTNRGTLRDIRLYNINVTGGSYTSCLAGINYGEIQKVLIDGLKIMSNGQGIAPIAGRNSSGGLIDNCLVMATSGESGSGDNTIYSTHTNPYIGGIAGYNDSYSSGIKNVCVLDKRQTSSIPFVNSKNTSNTTAGIVGHNESSLKNAIYLAMPPHGYINLVHCQFPICRYYGVSYNNTQNNYYLRIFSYYLRGENTGIGRKTSVRYSEPGSNYYYSFNELSVKDLGLDPNFWERVEGYPYPKLKSFPTPSTWPVAN